MAEIEGEILIGRGCGRRAPPGCWPRWSPGWAVARNRPY